MPPPNSTHNHNTAANGSNSYSRLQLYRWMPIALTQSKGDNEGGDYGKAEFKRSSKDDGAAAEEPPKARFKYIPIVMFEEQKNESSEGMDDEIKSTDLNAMEATSGGDEKPDMNDVPMDENQESTNNQVKRQDLNESTNWI